MTWKSLLQFDTLTESGEQTCHEYILTTTLFSKITPWFLVFLKHWHIHQRHDSPLNNSSVWCLRLWCGCVEFSLWPAPISYEIHRQRGSSRAAVVPLSSFISNINLQKSREREFPLYTSVSASCSGYSLAPAAACHGVGAGGGILYKHSSQHNV